MNRQWPECIKGHEYTAENTGRVYRKGVPAERFCRTCARARFRKHYELHRKVNRKGAS
ncbi:hypothetical protein [Rhodococcus erythropolis]|uniref:hypothetical protein n=1 Tax=Rhodococcus erythropolis TaxID=1833 RepID=UPI0012D2C14A|nr:hypothetical protein [Rhodococcus erythropolis]